MFCAARFCRTNAFNPQQALGIFAPGVQRVSESVLLSMARIQSKLLQVATQRSVVESPLHYHLSQLHIIAEVKG
jgi:hypothetical protein